MQQAQQDAEAATEAEAEAVARESTVKLSPGQLQRLRDRNQELIQRKAQGAAAKQREAEERVARLEAIQDQVCCCF